MRNDKLKLRECPFCGGNSELYSRDYIVPQEHAIFCKKCDAMSSYKDTKQEAIEAWNKRAKER